MKDTDIPANEVLCFWGDVTK